MPVPCGRSLDALWCNEERSNAWVWLRNSGWRKLAETDFDYKFRYNERYTQLFSSHAVIYQKVTE